MTTATPIQARCQCRQCGGGSVAKRVEVTSEHSRMLLDDEGALIARGCQKPRSLYHGGQPIYGNGYTIWTEGE